MSEELMGSPGVRIRVSIGCVNKNFNLGHNFLTRREKVFILHMCIPYDKNFHMVPLFLTSWPWPLSSTYFLKNFNLGHNFLTTRDRAFISHVYSLWQDLSHHTIIFDLMTLTLKFGLLSKNFNHGFYLVMVAARRAPLSSDNSYYLHLIIPEIFLLKQCTFCLILGIWAFCLSI